MGTPNRLQLQTLQIGAVGNSAYRVELNAVRFSPAPTGGESVYLFLAFTIIFGSEVDNDLSIALFA